MTTTKLCEIEGCEKVVTSRSWCSMHAHRLRRHGDPDAVHVAQGWTTWNGYDNVTAVGHPLRRGDRVAVGRLVLWDKLGPGPHLCTWCDRPLEWGVNLRAARVNGDRADSSPENLVAACASCILERSRRATTRGGTPMKKHDVPTPQASSQLQSATFSDSR